MYYLLILNMTKILPGWKRKFFFVWKQNKYWFEKHFFDLLIESTIFLIILGFNLLLHKTNIFNYLKHEDQWWFWPPLLGWKPHRHTGQSRFSEWQKSPFAGFHLIRSWSLCGGHYTPLTDIVNSVRMHIFIEESNQSWFIVFWWLFVVKNAAKLSLFFDSHLLSVLLPVYSVNGVIDDADKLDILSNVHVYLWFKFYYKPWGKFPRKMWMKILITVIICIFATVGTLH